MESLKTLPLEDFLEIENCKGSALYYEWINYTKTNIKNYLFFFNIPLFVYIFEATL